MHEAVRADEPEALTTMLDIYETMKRDADINEQNNRQETVLHLAAKEGFLEHISRLVLFGADLSIKVGSVTEGREREGEGWWGEREGGIERENTKHKKHLQTGALWGGPVHQGRLRDRGEREGEGG